MSGGFRWLWMALCLFACSREGGSMRAAVPELSGLVKSRTLPGVFWAHGDSGNAAELVAIDKTGRTLGRYDVNARNYDWEDIAADDAGHLYLGDIGDNFGLRDDVRILVLDEPEKISKRGTLRVRVTQRFRYPEIVPGTPKRLDAEALFFAAGHLYLMSKERFSTRSALFRFPAQLTSEKKVTLDRIDSIELRAKPTQGGAPVTAADVSRDESRVAVTVTKHFYVFRFDGHTLRERLLMERLPKAEGFEAVAFDGEHLLAARESGQLLSLPLPREARPEHP